MLAGCRQKLEDSFDWDCQDRIEYIVDYTVSFAADHDSAMQVTARGNYGTVKVVRIESENLFDADGKPVNNSFIVLEDTVPMGKSITLSTGGLSYVGGNPDFLHVQTVGSDDLVELKVAEGDTYTLYSIRDNLFYGPDEQQSFTIGGGKRFSMLLPVMTEERYPRQKESHRIQIAFDIAEEHNDTL